MSDRPIRPCMECRAYDDHPRHRHADKTLPGGHTLRHLDCCAAATGCEACTASVAEASGKTGPALIAHLAAARAARTEG